VGEIVVIVWVIYLNCCKIWGSHRGEDSFWVPLDCDTV